MNRNKPQSYKDIVSIPENLKEKLPTSYDVIGNIILLKLDEKLMGFKEEIGNSLLLANKNTKTVCLVKPVSGEYRTRNVEIIAGEKQTETCHHEYGLNFYLDVKKTYFSPRLANERRRITKMTKPGETVVDMFTGVAPFPIMIAKNSDPKIIYAIDKNENAINYANKNIRVNNILDKIELINGNSKDIEKLIPKELSIDRIIMNLPLESSEFFQYALGIVDEKSSIHYYTILSNDKITDHIELLIKVADRKNIILENIEINKIKSYAPHEFYMCFDITARKN